MVLDTIHYTCVILKDNDEVEWGRGCNISRPRGSPCEERYQPGLDRENSYWNRGNAFVLYGIFYILIL